MRAMLDEKTIGNDPSSLFNGNHYPSIYIYMDINTDHFTPLALHMQEN